jgi:hypothetical protein
MQTVVGIFTSRTAGEQVVEQLRSYGIPDDCVNLLTPQEDEKAIQSVPTTQTEQPGMGKALGGVVGGAAGMAAGAHLTSILASVIVPGVGPVIAIGLAASALLGIGGAVGGALAGGALEDSLATGLPQDELFVYEDALRRGRTVVFALASDEEQAEVVRNIFTRAGAESLDAARDQWWVGLRSAEEEEYTLQGGNFLQDEPEYQAGFEAALRRDLRGKPYPDALPVLRQRYPESCHTEAFQKGFARGQLYQRHLLERATPPSQLHP